MKLKLDFVTNSSSTAYIITNNSNKRLSLVDFVKENPELIEEFKEMYAFGMEGILSQKNLLISAICNNVWWEPGEKKHIVFGDEDGTLIGDIFDYILRTGGSSKNFYWEYEDSYR